MFIINYSVPCLSDGTITHLLHLVWKQWADATTCTVKRNELVEILARLKRPAKQIELAGEAFQREELKSSLQESRQIGLYLLWFDVWLDVKSVERRKEDRGEVIKEEREEKGSTVSENWESVWYVCLKTENYCLKIFVKIRVGEKIHWNMWNIV